MGYEWTNLYGLMITLAPRCNLSEWRNKRLQRCLWAFAFWHSRDSWIKSLNWISLVLSNYPLAHTRFRSCMLSQPLQQYCTLLLASLLNSANSILWSIRDYPPLFFLEKNFGSEVHFCSLVELIKVEAYRILSVYFTHSHTIHTFLVVNFFEVHSL